jgi:hypothetical protein
MRHLKNAWVAAAVMAAIGAGVVHAQIRDAGSKIRDDYMPGGYTSASRSLYHARDYANDYRSYVQQVSQSKQPVDPEVAKEHADGLAHNIAKLQTHLVSMRKHAAGDKETLASLDAIDKHVQDAAKQQAAMSEMCAKPEVDAKGSMKCCDDASKSLDQAIAEHDKLMKKLAAKKKLAIK